MATIWEKNALGIVFGIASEESTSWDSEWEIWRWILDVMTTKRMKSVQGKPVGMFHSECYKLFMYVPASTLRPLQCGGYVPIVHPSIVHLALFEGTTMVVVDYLSKELGYRTKWTLRNRSRWFKKQCASANCNNIRIIIFMEKNITKYIWRARLAARGVDIK